jgi:predicted transcriptional regulator
MRRNHEIYEDEDERDADRLIAFTVDVVTAHLGHNNVALADVPGFIQQVHGVLAALAAPVAEEDLAPVPIVSIASSVKPSHIICLECGRKCQVLKPHIRAAHGLTPTEYRAKWQLPESYPMAAKEHVARARERAIAMGLGDKMRAARSAKRAKAGHPPMARTLKAVGGTKHGK